MVGTNQSVKVQDRKENREKESQKSMSKKKRERKGWNACIMIREQYTPLSSSSGPVTPTKVLQMVLQA